MLNLFFPGAKFADSADHLSVGRSSTRLIASQSGFYHLKDSPGFRFFEITLDLFESICIHDDRSRSSALADNYGAIFKVADDFGRITLKIRDGNLFDHAAPHYKLIYAYKS